MSSLFSSKFTPTSSSASAPASTMSTSTLPVFTFGNSSSSSAAAAVQTQQQKPTFSFNTSLINLDNNNLGSSQQPLFGGFSFASTAINPFQPINNSPLIFGAASTTPTPPASVFSNFNRSTANNKTIANSNFQFNNFNQQQNNRSSTRASGGGEARAESPLNRFKPLQSGTISSDSTTTTTTSNGGEFQFKAPNQLIIQSIPTQQTKHDNSSLTDSLECIICLSLQLDIVESSCCHQIFCRTCSRQLPNHKCSICRRTNFQFQENFIVKRLISSIKHNCAECAYETTLGELDEHKSKCPERKLKCARANCAFEGKRDMLFQHVFDSHKNELVAKMSDNNWLKEYLN